MAPLTYVISSKLRHPDLLVAWFVKVETVRDIDIYGDYYGRWRYFHHTNVSTYKEGSLVIDIIDRVNNQVVWHGKTSEIVYENMPNVEEKINSAVNAMFKRFVKDTRPNKGYAFR